MRTKRAGRARRSRYDRTFLFFFLMQKQKYADVSSQLVEAGWKYTPMLESDDHATCTYCHLGLDGWEKSDKPWYEDKTPSFNARLRY
jgi:hypothetical protein